MLILDYNDQDSDDLLERYRKNPSSLSDQELIRLQSYGNLFFYENSITYNKGLATYLWNDLLKNGVPPLNHESYPYAAGSKDVLNKIADNKRREIAILNGGGIIGWWKSLSMLREQSPNEKTFHKAEQVLINYHEHDWERQIANPVMNFLPGFIGFAYNAIDTAQGGYSLGQGIGQIYREGEFTTDATLKIINGALTVTPVVMSNGLPRIFSKNPNPSLLIPETNPITLSPGNNVISYINSGKSGSIAFEKGSTPNLNEIRAANTLLNLGYDVLIRKEINQHEVRTSDLWVNSIGKIDVYTPRTTKLDNIITAIEKKNTQTSSVLVQIDLSYKDMNSIAARMWGKPNARNINIIFFQDSKGHIHRFNRPVLGGK